jgi:aspartyl protease family protein
MANASGPWSKPPLKARVSGHRLLLRAVVILALLVGAIELSQLFPGAISKQDELYLLRGLFLLGFLSTSTIFFRQVRPGELARNILIWTVVGIVLVLGYTYRDDFTSVGARVESELLPSEPVADIRNHTETLSADRNGEFYVYGVADGARIRFVVDTGASDIVLSPSDAARLGVDTKALKYVPGFETANGIGAGADYSLSRLSIGSIQMFNVPVSINRMDMHASLLGMAFLKRLKSFEFAGRKLYLRW